jgi:hypothetical protein
MQVRRRQGHSGGAASAEYPRVPQYRGVKSTAEYRGESLKLLYRVVKCETSNLAPKLQPADGVEMWTHPLQRGPLRCNTDLSVATQTNPLQRGPPRCNEDHPVATHHPVPTGITPLQQGSLRCNTDHPVATQTSPVATQTTPLQRGKTSCNAVRHARAPRVSPPVLLCRGWVRPPVSLPPRPSTCPPARGRHRCRRRRLGWSRRASYRTHGAFASGAPPGTETLGTRRGPSRLLLFSAPLTAVGADVAW